MKYKHLHGTKNPIIEQEEKSILLAVDRALSSSPNSQTIGRNGELPLISFFDRYLPPTFKAVSGHFITPNGNISPQLDIMILDSRYPLLAQNTDDTVLAMLHSVIQVFEIKTNITSTDVRKISSNFIKTRKLMCEISEFSDPNSFLSPAAHTVAYRTKNKLSTISKAFKETCEPEDGYYDLTILRLSENNINEKEVGCELHYNPIPEEVGLDLKNKFNLDENSFKDGYLLTNRASYTPLSDVYYSLIQNGYYILGDRNYEFGDIGEQVMSYMEWSTASWKDISD